MANRRMFHAAVVESDAFLALPPKAQALYFHLGMHSDDDGFINRARQLAKSGFGGEKTLALLAEKGFILMLEDLVVQRHFRLANALKSDREGNLQYPEQARKLYITRDKCYTLEPEEGLLSLWEIKQKFLDKHRKTKNSKLENESASANSKLESNRTELNVTELNRTELNRAEENAAGVGGDGARSLNRMNGQLGQGVILLNDLEQERLLDLLGLDGFDYYVKKLSDFILANDAQVNNHFATIIKWAKQDRRISNDCE